MIPIFQSWLSSSFLNSERKLKYDVEDDDEADTLTFDQKNTFYFQANKSLPLTGQEIVTIPHLVIQMGLLMVQRDQAPLLPLAIKGLMELFDNPTKPFFTETVSDLLFDGVPINCDRSGFEAKSVCSALEDTLGESSIINDTHLAMSLFKAVRSNSFKLFQSVTIEFFLAKWHKYWSIYRLSRHEEYIRRWKDGLV